VPYKNEAKSFHSIKRLAENERIAALYKRCKILSSDKLLVGLTTIKKTIEPAAWAPDLAVAIDGSEISHQVDNGYPGAEVGYVTASAVLLNVKNLKAADQNRPIDPRVFRSLETAQSIDAGLPGPNVILDECEDSSASFRRAFFELLRDTKLDSDSEPLLDTYEALVAYRADDKTMECPYRELCSAGSKSIVVSLGEKKCESGRSHFCTDLLRIHEGLREDAGNQSVYTESMQVLERLLLINLLRTLSASPALVKGLHRVVFLVDGPLAVHGHPAWLSRSIMLELRRLNDAILDATGEGLLIIGVEKSGLFVEHFNHIDIGDIAADTGSIKKEGSIDPGSTYLLTDKYIKERIIYSDSPKMYGSQTYFGRKFFYKTLRGSLLTCSTPFFTVESEDLNDNDPKHFQRLPDILASLEVLWSSRYENALAPVIQAHAEATIPLNLGKALLKKLTAEMVAN